MKDWIGWWRPHFLRFRLSWGIVGILEANCKRPFGASAMLKYEILSLITSWSLISSAGELEIEDALPSGSPAYFRPPSLV